MDYQYKANKYKSKLDQLPQVQLGGSGLVDKQPLEIDIHVGDTTRRKIYIVSSKDKDPIKTMGDLKRQVGKDRYFRDYQQDPILFRYNSGDFTSLVGTTISISRQGFLPTENVTFPGDSRGNNNSANAIRTRTSHISSKKSLLCYTDDMYENMYDKRSLMSESDTKSMVSKSQGWADPYVCRVTSYDLETDICVCRHNFVNRKTIHHSSKLIYDYDHKPFTTPLTDQTLLSDISSADHKCQLVLYNNTTIEKRVKIVNAAGDLYTYTVARDGYLDGTTILDIKKWIRKKEGYRLEDLSLHQEGDTEPLADTTSLNGINYLFLLRRDPMVDGQYDGMTAQLRFNTLEVYKDDDWVEGEDDEDEDDYDDNDQYYPAYYRSHPHRRGNSRHHRQEPRKLPRKLPRKVTEVRNLVTREVNIHQTIGDVINSFITDDVQIDEFKPLDERLTIKKAIGFRDWYQSARKNDFVLEYRVDNAEPCTVNLTTELSSLRAGYNKKTGKYDDNIVINIVCIPKS